MALYLIGTPIGNLDDITLRAINTLRQTGVVLVEKWSDSIKLLNHLEIKPEKIMSFDERNRRLMIPKIIDLLKTTDVAFITSAGMPGVSDPGASLVAECRRQNINVIPIPGPSALTTAISIAGFPGDYLFVGFLPKKPGQIKNILNKARDGGNNLVFFESSHRIRKTLELINLHCPDITIFLGKEMTKCFEHYLSTSAKKLLQMLDENPSFGKGEFTIIASFTKKKPVRNSFE